MRSLGLTLPYLLRVSTSHQKAVIDVDFCNETLLGTTELYILPLIEDLSTIHINCRQSDVTSVSINSVACNFTYQDSIKDSLALLKEGTVNNHPDLKQRWSMATAEDDEGELAVMVPKGLVIPSMLDEETINRASNVVDTSRDVSTPEPSTPQTPAAAPVLASGVTFATLIVRIEFKLEGPTAGVFFAGPDPVNAPNRAHTVYTINQPLPGATRLWLPCLDRLAERCTWDIDFIVPSYAPGEEYDLDDGDWSAEDYDEDEKVQVICSGDLIQQTTHQSIPGKTVFHYSIQVPTPAASISFVAGVFEVIKLSLQDYTMQGHGDGDDDDAGDDDDDENEKPAKTPAHLRGEIPDMFAFCPPRRLSELRNTCAFMVKAMEFFMHEIGSYPFSTYKMVFVEDSWAPTFTSATMAVCSTSLLHPEDVIDQVYESRKLLTQSLAQQWFGIHIVPKSWPDIWIIVGLTNYVSSLFLKKMFGTNEYRFRMKKDVERCCSIDRDRPPLYNPNIAYPIDLDDLEFIGLKAPLVLHMLDKRMSKGGSSLGLSRVIPKILVSVMSGELTHNAIGTHWFLKTCRKVSGLETKGFSDQWIYNSGCPIFFFSYHFNRKKMVVEINMRQSSTNGHINDRARHAANGEHPPPTLFTGTMTARIHEADGTPYEHVLDIQDVGKRFEVQFNTKYKRIRRNTKRFQAKQAAAAAAAREAEEEGDVEEGLGALGFGAGLWEDEKEKEEWQVVEWGQDDELGAISATFEWIRLDAEFEWLCELRFEQPDFMWAAQLQKDRDVVAQYEAILALGSLPSPAASTSLLKTLLDTRCFFRVRMEAAYAVAKCAGAATEWVGLLHLIKTFQQRYCYPSMHITTFQDPNSTIPCMPKPNDFSSLAEYYVQKAIPVALANIRDERGHCPIKVRQFLLDLLRFNDNTGNVFSDNYYVSTLISALGHALIPGHSLARKQDDDGADEDDFEQMDEAEGAEILAQAIREIDRYRTLDYLIPTYHNTVTVSCLQATMRLMLAGIIPRDLKPFMMHSRFGNFLNVRLTSLDSLLLLGALDQYKASEYLCNVIEQDPSPYVRFHLAQGMTELLGVLMARDDFDSHRDLQESLLVEEDGIQSGQDLANQRGEASALQGLDMIRKLYGHQGVLRTEVWRILTSLPYLEHRILKYLLLFCDILYPPGESILPKLAFKPVQKPDVVMEETPVAPAPLSIPEPMVPAAHPMVIPPAPYSSVAPISSLPSQLPISLAGSLPNPAHSVTHSVPIPAMAPALLAAVASSPMMQQSREHVQAPAVIHAPIIAAPVPVTPKPLKAKPDVPKAPKAAKTKAPTTVPAFESAPTGKTAGGLPKEPEPLSLSLPHVKEEPMTSPKLMPKAASEFKFVKSPSKKADIKPKPPPVPKDVSLPPPVVEKSIVAPVPPKAQSEDRPRKAVQTMPPEHVRQCRRVWKKMVTHKSSLHFRSPVDPIAENIPTYPDIVKHPMDLGTIKNKLDGGNYGSLQSFEEDVRLMINNCFKFNQIGTYVYNEGQELETVFEKEWTDILVSAGATVPELNITIVETPKKASASSAPLPIAHAPSLSKSSVPKVDAGTLPPAPRKASVSKPVPAVAHVPALVPLGHGHSSASSPATPHPPKEKSVASHGPSGASIPTTKFKSSDVSKCKDVLKKLMSDPCAFEFLQPVDPERQGIPLYPKIIAHPMDLGTISKKLKAEEYHSAHEVRADIELVIFNCRKFNPRGTYVVNQADSLEALMVAEWDAAFGRGGHSKSGVVANEAPAKAKSKALKVDESISKTKSTDAVASGGSGARRPSVSAKPKSGKAVEPTRAELEKFMDKILKKIVAHKHATPFQKPVDYVALNLPNYPDLIKKPMDFRTIREKVTQSKYPTLDDFADDVRLVCQNCVNFNGLEHPFSQGGLVIQTLLIKELESAKKELARLYPTSTINSSAGSGSGGGGSGSAKSQANDELSAHKKIIDKLKLNVDFGVFAVPVDPIALGIPTYFDIIKRPMDFGTIERNLVSGAYRSGEEVVHDVRLVFSNCALFNSHPGDPVAAMGDRLRKVWENMIKKEGLLHSKASVSSPAPSASPIAKHKVDSPTATPKKPQTASPKSSSTNFKFVPAYIPSASTVTVPGLASPHHHQQGRRGSSTPAPTPLRNVTTPVSSGSQKYGSASASNTPASHQGATFGTSSSKGQHHHTSSNSKHGRKQDYSSGSDLSDPDDDEDDGAAPQPTGPTPIRLQAPHLMSPPPAPASSHQPSRHDGDSGHKKRRREYEEAEVDSSDGSDDDAPNDDRDRRSSSGSKKRKMERSYSEEYGSSTSSRKEHRHHSSSHRSHKSSPGSSSRSHKERRDSRDREVDLDRDRDRSRDRSRDRDRERNRDSHRDHKEHKKHKKSKKHRKHKKRSSEDRDHRDRYYSDQGEGDFEGGGHRRRHRDDDAGTGDSDRDD